jgi:hypothetical protein
MYRFFLSILLCTLSFSGFAQQLVFTNVSKNKVITARPGNMVYITYTGYNGQHEFATNLVSGITDSTITLGLDPQTFMKGRRYNATANSYKVINIKDITAFRKRSVGGVLLNSLVSVGSVVGAVFLLSDLVSSNNISTGNALLISGGVGLAVRFGTLLLFPANAKYRMQDGWTVKAINTVD